MIASNVKEESQSATGGIKFKCYFIIYDNTHMEQKPPQKPQFHYCMYLIGEIELLPIFTHEINAYINVLEQIREWKGHKTRFKKQQH